MPHNEHEFTTPIVHPVDWGGTHYALDHPVDRAESLRQPEGGMGSQPEPDQRPGPETGQDSNIHNLDEHRAKRAGDPALEGSEVEDPSHQAIGA